MDCMNRNGEKKLHIVYGDLTLGVYGEDISCIFSYQTGGLESLVTGGKEWLYRTPRPTFWRALTDNDRGSGFHLKSGMWLSADMFIKCTDIRIRVEDEEIGFPKAPDNNRYTGNEQAEKISIEFVYTTISVPSTEVSVTYTVEAEGKIRVDVHYFGNSALPQLPVFGMRFIMPTKAVSYQYEGLSGETYPDRMAGGVPGIYTVEGLPVTPYLVPQDCGVHMETKWLRVYRNTAQSNVNKGASGKTALSGLQFSAVDKNFAFSCLPFTAEELENATHMEELPFARRTVVSILGAVRGVGGINSWGADVENAYHIDAGKDIRYSFSICATDL